MKRKPAPQAGDLAAARVGVSRQKASLGRDAQNDWAAFKLDAERKAGALLSEMKASEQRAAAGRPRKSPHDEGFSVAGPPTLVELGVADQPERARQRAHRWEALAAIPERFRSLRPGDRPA